MTSEDDKQALSGRSHPGASETDSEFGPPLSEFGPPLSDVGASGWSPAEATERPDVSWRPADAAPAPLSQYRPSDPDSPQPSSDARSAEVTSDASQQATPRPARRSDDDTWWQSASSGSPTRPARETGSLWDDDSLIQQLTPKSLSATPRTVGLPRRSVLLGVVAAAVLAAGVVGTVLAVPRGRDGRDTTVVATTSTVASNCPAHSNGKVTVGNGPGDTSSSGVAAILGFQYAFYVERSGANARAFAALDANFATADAIQHAIDSEIPKGTTHCLHIEEVAHGWYNVDVTEYRPNGATTRYPQQVSVMNRDGKYQIWAIYQR